MGKSKFYFLPPVKNYALSRVQKNFIVRICVILSEELISFSHQINKVLFTLLSMMILISTAILSHAGTPYFSMGFGAGLAKIGHTQYYSPTSGLMHYYSADSKREIVAPLISLGTGYRFDMNNHSYTSLGIEADYINYGDPKGRLHPGVNIDPDFDRLSYSYSAESYLLMLKGSWEFGDHNWLPYLSLGLGLSFNQLGNYSEGTNNTAAPARNLYKRNITQDTGYSVDIGLYQYKLKHNIDLTLAYRFIYSGNAYLKNPVSGNNAISSGILNGHFITLSFNLL